MSLCSKSLLVKGLGGRGGHVTSSIHRIVDVPPAHAKRLRPTAWGAVSSVAIATRLLVADRPCLRHLPILLSTPPGYAGDRNGVQDNSLKLIIGPLRHRFARRLGHLRQGVQGKRE